MEHKKLGKTGLTVNPLGIGLAEIGFQLKVNEEKKASDVLNSALDSGINFLDTAACYDISEEMLGRAVSHRRDEYVLATKAGHFLPRDEGEDWTYDVVIKSVDRSLSRMKTDRVDLLQIHSCDVEILERGDVIRAIQDAKAAGKTRFLGYSGDNENAEWAVTSGLFDTIQTSFNLVDQNARRVILPEAERRNMGVIIKRPIGNAVWGVDKDPEPYPHPYTEEYFSRAQEMQNDGPLRGQPENRILLALGFTFAHPQVDVAIVGTRSPEHLRSNLELLDNGMPISGDTVSDLHERFDRIGQDWEQKG